MSDNELEQIMNLSYEEEYTRCCTGESLDLDKTNEILSKIKFNKPKECCICYDESNKTWLLPCCGKKNAICKECLENTLTKTSTNCPICRKNLVTNIELNNINKSNKSKNNSNHAKNNKNNKNIYTYSIEKHNLTFTYVYNHQYQILKFWTCDNVNLPLKFNTKNIEKKHIDKIIIFIKYVIKNSNKYKKNQWIKLYKKCKTFKNKFREFNKINNYIFNDFINSLYI